jgi:hypothetical protein
MVTGATRLRNYITYIGGVYSTPAVTALDQPALASAGRELLEALEELTAQVKRDLTGGYYAHSPLGSRLSNAEVAIANARRVAQ